MPIAINWWIGRIRKTSRWFIQTYS